MSARPKVLFVDDDAGVLAGMRALLRREREDFDFVFAGGGQAALDALSTDTFDVVVCDLQMPDVDGATVLAVASARQPHIARIVLTGAITEADAMRMIPVAHQFLAKPCSAAQFRMTLDRARRLRGTLNNPDVRQALAGLQSLSSPPQTFLGLTRLLDSSDVDLAAVAALIERDPAVTAKLLQVANSAFFAPPRVIETVQMAVMRLGANLVHSLVAAIDGLGRFEHDMEQSGEDLDHLIEHAMAVGRLCRCIAPDAASESVAVLAGVLHDIGRLALCAAAPDVVRLARAATTGSGEPSWIVERRELGFTHADAGAYLLSLWGLPNVLVEAVATHHEPASCVGLAAPTIVHLADGLLRAAQDDVAPYTAGYVDQNHIEASGLAESLHAWSLSAAEIAAAGH